jgi:hypothetical protein
LARYPRPLTTTLRRKEKNPKALLTKGIEYDRILLNTKE